MECILYGVPLLLRLNKVSACVHTIAYSHYQQISLTTNGIAFTLAMCMLVILLW